MQPWKYIRTNPNDHIAFFAFDCGAPAQYDPHDLVARNAEERYESSMATAHAHNCDELLSSDERREPGDSVSPVSKTFVRSSLTETVRMFRTMADPFTDFRVYKRASVSAAGCLQLTEKRICR